MPSIHTKKRKRTSKWRIQPAKPPPTLQSLPLTFFSALPTEIITTLHQTSKHFAQIPFPEEMRLRRLENFLRYVITYSKGEKAIWKYLRKEQNLPKTNIPPRLVEVLLTSTMTQAAIDLVERYPQMNLAGTNILIVIARACSYMLLEYALRNPTIQPQQIENAVHVAISDASPESLELLLNDDRCPSTAEFASDLEGMATDPECLAVLLASPIASHYTIKEKIDMALDSLAPECLAELLTSDSSIIGLPMATSIVTRLAGTDNWACKLNRCRRIVYDNELIKSFAPYKITNLRLDTMQSCLCCESCEPAETFRLLSKIAIFNVDWGILLRRVLTEGGNSEPWIPLLLMRTSPSFADIQKYVKAKSNPLSFRLLLDNATLGSQECESLLELLCHHNKPQLLEVLLNCRPDVGSAHNHCGLRTVIQKGHWQCLDLILPRLNRDGRQGTIPRE